MREVLTALFMLMGGLFMLLASVGIARMPDLFTRMQASTKGATLGAGCLLVAVAFYFADAAITTRVLMIIFFLLMTAPVSAHIIARAAYFVGTPVWEGTCMDELKGCYDADTHSLSSGSTAAGEDEESPEAGKEE